ncbi:MAG TPA: signal transduction histidine kinase (STHK), LytS [Xenococcaceae cyanobacterium]|jgi:hypothetical protein
MSTYKRAVGLFYSRDEAEAALRALKDDGFDMKRVNLIARDADKVREANDLGRDDETVEEGNNTSEGAGAGATSGAVLGGIGGLLVGIGTLAIPGVGPIIVAGEAAGTIASTLAGAGIGAAAGGLIGALVGMGIPEEKAKVYSDRVKGGSYLVMANGTEDEVHRAESILNDNGIEEFGIYDAPDLNQAGTTVEPMTEASDRAMTVEPTTTRGDHDRMVTPDRDAEVIRREERERIK